MSEAGGDPRKEKLSFPLQQMRFSTPMKWFGPKHQISLAKYLLQ